MKPIRALLAIAGSSLIAWTLYDATSVVQALHLSGVASEAAVAISSLLLGTAAMLTGLLAYRRTDRVAS